MAKISLKIAPKIGLSFGLITLALIVNAILINRVLNKTKQLNSDISSVYQPSEVLLKQYQDMVSRSTTLTYNWVFADKISVTPDKLELVKIHTKVFPDLISKLSQYTDQWEDSSMRAIQAITRLVSDSLFAEQKYVMTELNSFDAYNDASVFFMVQPLVLDGGEIIKLNSRILKDLNSLVVKQENQIAEAREQMNSFFGDLKRYITTTSIILVILSVVLALITARTLAVPINSIKNTLLKMSRGVLPENKMNERSDEIGQMAKALNQLVAGLKAISGFALEIGRGNYKSSFTPLSEDDVLGNSLLRMRDDLHAAAVEEAKRKLEDEQRNWATAGLAKFSEILRQDNDKIDVFSYNIISNMVKYLDANQGGVFLINDTDSHIPFIELISFYAYNRKKHLQKKIEMGEGLVGRSILEKETIYLTDIPDDYIKITSGLGDANPRSLLLVPLKMNDDVFGVIEIASFNEIQPYQVEFVEKIAEIMASTLRAVKINMQTSKLLEQSRIQTEELAAQEEEMRQNMEELRATQEQSQRRERELEDVVADLQKKLGTGFRN